MAMLAKGIVGGEMAWPLIVVGVLMGFALIMIEVRSPMLFAVGMYLPLETTFAIFLGGMIRWVTDKMRDSKNFNDAQKARVENAGVLTASGFIAGEALMGIVIAIFKIQTVAAAGDLPAPQRDFGLYRAGDSGDRDGARAAGQCGHVRMSRLRRRRSCRASSFVSTVIPSGGVAGFSVAAVRHRWTRTKPVILSGGGAGVAPPESKDPYNLQEPPTLAR